MELQVLKSILQGCCWRKKPFGMSWHMIGSVRYLLFFSGNTICLLTSGSQGQEILDKDHLNWKWRTLITLGLNAVALSALMNTAGCVQGLLQHLRWESKWEAKVVRKFEGHLHCPAVRAPKCERVRLARHLHTHSFASAGWLCWRGSGWEEVAVWSLKKSWRQGQ